MRLNSVALCEWRCGTLSKPVNDLEKGGLKEPQDFVPQLPIKSPGH